jgi:hypothetical protein
MEKLEKLTPEQEVIKLKIKNFWLDYIFSCKNSINKEQAKIGIDFIYNLANLKQPQVIYVESPIGCQIANLYLKEYLKLKPELLKDKITSVGASMRDSVGDSVEDSVEASVRASVWASVRASVGDSVWDSVRASVGDSVEASVRASVEASVRASVEDNKFEQFSSYGNIGDYGWISFYDFFTEIDIINNDKFNQFKKLLLSGIYDMIQLNGFCIVSNMPNKIKRNNQEKLHCENDSAISWRDGYELFFWNGVNVPKQLIKNPETITKENIISLSNAEIRRCYMEKLGAKRYYEIAYGGVKILDEDIDDCGNKMVLYESKEFDIIINKKVQFLECICPSTKRVYNIFTPHQDSINVWQAKADTFNKEKIEVRHGDVGLLNLNKEYNKPSFET